MSLDKNRVSFVVFQQMRVLIFIFLSAYLYACGSIKEPINTVKASDLTSISSIPSDCKDHRKNFKPVTHILSKGSYNLKPKSYSPIADPKGFIAEDFNDDKITDYLFIERTKKDIQVILCLSDKHRLSRKIIPFKVHETIEPDFQTISEAIQFTGTVLILSLYKHEHNWGSDSKISTYTYNRIDKDFILETQETTSTSGDGLRSDTYEFYDFKNQYYTVISTCGGLEEGCKPFNRSGRIIPAKKQSTLLRKL